MLKTFRNAGVEVSFMNKPSGEVLKGYTFIFLLLSFIFFSLLTISCTGRRSKLDHRDMIPESKLPALLAEVYMSDGLLTLPSVRAMYSTLDSLSAYSQVVEKHGYTKEVMDKTMKYYFIKKPKQLIKIYDRTLGILTEMESLVEKEVLLIQSRIENRWTGKNFFFIPDPLGSDSIHMDVPLEIPGYYDLKFRATVFPADGLYPAAIHAYTCHRDSSATGLRDYIRSVNFIKDGRPHYYSIRILVPENRPIRLRGYFHDPAFHPEPWDKHAIIDNISLTYSVAAV